MCLSIHEVSVTLGGKMLLHNINLDFKPNEFTVILGKNGTGKSTLLKVISGDIPIHSTVNFYKRYRENWPLKELAASVGVLPQHSNLSFGFTVEEVVHLGGVNLNRRRKELNEIVTSVMQQTDVAHLASQPYPILSGGEKQRVHLARVLMQLHDAPRDKILLLDEPTSALDIRHQHKTLALAKSLALEGACVIAVLHDLNLAAEYADRILMLSEGQIIADGSPNSTLTQQNIAAAYEWQPSIISHPTKDHPLIVN